MASLKARRNVSRDPATSRLRLVGFEKPKTEPDAVLERIGGMIEADREALLPALRDQPDGKGKKTG